MLMEEKKNLKWDFFFKGLYCGNSVKHWKRQLMVHIKHARIILFQM